MKLDQIEQTIKQKESGVLLLIFQVFYNIPLNTGT